MKKLLPLFILLTLGCVTLVPTPDDFPPPPMTVIVELPIVTPTTTLEPRLMPITPEGMQDAQTFQLLLFTYTAAGDSEGIAEMVKYPIRVNLDGEAMISTPEEFSREFSRIFNKTVMDALSNTDPANLTLLPEGVRVGRGELWFNLFCVDVTCSDSQFLITQINN